MDSECEEERDCLTELPLGLGSEAEAEAAGERALEAGPEAAEGQQRPQAAREEPATKCDTHFNRLDPTRRSLSSPSLQVGQQQQSAAHKRQRFRSGRRRPARTSSLVDGTAGGGGAACPKAAASSTTKALAGSLLKLRRKTALGLVSTSALAARTCSSNGAQQAANASAQQQQARLAWRWPWFSSSSSSASASDSAQQLPVAATQHSTSSAGQASFGTPQCEENAHHEQLSPSPSASSATTAAKQAESAPETKRSTGIQLKGEKICGKFSVEFFCLPPRQIHGQKECQLAALVSYGCAQNAPHARPMESATTRKLRRRKDPGQSICVRECRRLHWKTIASFVLSRVEPRKSAVRGDTIGAADFQCRPMCHRTAQAGRQLRIGGRKREAALSSFPARARWHKL